MADFVMYHNPEKMSVDVEAMPAFSIVTNKEPKDVCGSRVWLLTGRGSPRKYYLRSYFTVDRHEQNRTPEFKTLLSGNSGKAFNPMIELNEEPWFEDFKRSQQNFRLGFQLIKEDRFIHGLELLAAQRKSAEGE